MDIGAEPSERRVRKHSVFCDQKGKMLTFRVVEKGEALASFVLLIGVNRKELVELEMTIVNISSLSIGAITICE